MSIFKGFCYLVVKSKVLVRLIQYFKAQLRIDCSICGQNIRFLSITNRKWWIKKLSAFLLGHPVCYWPGSTKLSRNEVCKIGRGPKAKHEGPSQILQTEFPDNFARLSPVIFFLHPGVCFKYGTSRAGNLSSEFNWPERCYLIGRAKAPEQ